MTSHKNFICTTTKYLEQKLGIIPITTGSHAFEIHTQSKIEHSDIDFNIYTLNPLNNDIGKVKDELERILKQQGLSQITTKFSDNRLEIYIHEYGELRVEIVFIQCDKISTSKNGFVVNLDSDIKVPIEKKYLTKNKYCYIKTLEYMLATWLLRVSELATNQKRAVLGRDYKNLSVLLGQKYNANLVLKHIKKNPQFPKNCMYTPEEVKKVAISKTKASIV